MSASSMSPRAFALLRLALVDPRFFSDKRHPARRFLDLVIQKSLAWQGADMPGFAAFLDPARQAVQAGDPVRFLPFGELLY